MDNFLISLVVLVLVVLLLPDIERKERDDLRDMAGGANLRSTLTKRVFEYWFDGMLPTK